ncbi:Hypothetical predicted protein [Paramuricea clavata]|uniref:Uncharacterized protein n=1 Tax=Paramuricea clavata TaxID=317549 RepID=A0A7D9HML8_PARCT|nr:Hypothetical predicted protein [Paramuricea clavata]
MDILDAVAHLYEREQLNDDREPPIRQTLPMGYREKSDFCEQDECRTSGRHNSFDRYRCERDTSQPCDECNNAAVDVTALVEHFNGVFRQRINTEIENFRVSVNEIVDDQQMNFRSMFGLEQDVDPAQEVPMHMYSRSSSADNITSDYQVVVDNGKQNEQMSVTESPASTFNSYGASESEQGYPTFPPNDVQNQRDAENAMADKYLLRLMTATLVLGNTLRREEYRVF